MMTAGSPAAPANIKEITAKLDTNLQAWEASKAQQPQRAHLEASLRLLQSVDLSSASNETLLLINYAERTLIAFISIADSANALAVLKWVGALRDSDRPDSISGHTLKLYSLYFESIVKKPEVFAKFKLLVSDPAILPPTASVKDKKDFFTRSFKRAVIYAEKADIDQMYDWARKHFLNEGDVEEILAEAMIRAFRQENASYALLQKLEKCKASVRAYAINAFFDLASEKNLADAAGADEKHAAPPMTLKQAMDLYELFTISLQHVKLSRLTFEVKFLKYISEMFQPQQYFELGTAHLEKFHKFELTDNEERAKNKLALIVGLYENLVKRIPPGEDKLAKGLENNLKHLLSACELKFKNENVIVKKIKITPDTLSYITKAHDLLRGFVAMDEHAHNKMLDERRCLDVKKGQLQVDDASESRSTYSKFRVLTKGMSLRGLPPARRGRHLRSVTMAEIPKLEVPAPVSPVAQGGHHRLSSLGAVPSAVCAAPAAPAASAPTSPTASPSLKFTFS